MYISYNEDANHLRFNTCWKSKKIDKIPKSIITRFDWSPIVWRGGKRGEENFICSNMLVLDFDENKTIVEIKQNLDNQKKKFIIAPTKNHLKQKGNKPPCDRFRLILFFERIIMNLDEYKYNQRYYATSFGSDMQTTDGARFFYPSLNIDSFGAGENLHVFSIPSEDRLRDHMNERRRNINAWRFKHLGNLPEWINKFLEAGYITSDGRQSTCYAVACEMAKLGIDKIDCQRMIEGSPFDRQGFKDNEITNAVRSAYKRFG